MRNPHTRGGPAERQADRLNVGYRYGRAAAFAAKGRVDEATTELAELEKLAAASTADDSAGLNTAGDVFAVAILVVKATIADAEKRDTEVIALLTEAAAKEDRLAYDEPSDWFFPVRHELGAALLRSGRRRKLKPSIARICAGVRTTVGRYMVWSSR